MNLNTAIVLVALLGGGAAGAHALGYPLDPQEWPLGHSQCSSQGGAFEIRDRTVISRFTPLRDADWIRFEPDGHNMRVSGRSSIVDVSMGMFERIEFYSDGIEVQLRGGLTEKTELFFPTPEDDCQETYHTYRARHPHLLLKGG